MTVHNVELVRRWHLALSEGGKPGLAAINELWDVDADFYPVRKFPEARPCHGRKELADWLAEFRDAFPVTEWTVRELIAVADDRVLACTSMRAEGRASGVVLEGDVYRCVWLRHSRIFRVEDHMTVPGALKALGLEGATLEAAGLRDNR